MWDIITTEDKANNNVPQAGDVARVTNGCNADIRNTFLSGGSLLENLGSRLGLPADYTNLIRGLVGDVNLEGSANAYALQMLSDLYVRAETIAWKAREMLEKQAEASLGQPSENCAAVIFAEHADQNISIMLKRIRRLQM